MKTAKANEPFLQQSN